MARPPKFTAKQREEDREHLQRMIKRVSSDPYWTAQERELLLSHLRFSLGVILGMHREPGVPDGTSQKKRRAKVSEREIKIASEPALPFYDPVMDALEKSASGPVPGSTNGHSRKNGKGSRSRANP